MKHPITLLFLAMAILAIDMGCYSVPVVRTSDTTDQQASIAVAENNLRAVPSDSPRIGPKDQAAIDQGVRELDLCRKTLHKKDDQINKDVILLKECATNYADVKGERDELKSEVRWGFIGSVGSFFKGMFAMLVLVIIALAAAWFTGMVAKVAGMVKP